MPDKVMKVGIMSRQDYIKRTLAIAKGDYKPREGSGVRRALRVTLGSCRYWGVKYRDRIWFHLGCENLPARISWIYKFDRCHL
jgi:hypothetical protein